MKLIIENCHSWLQTDNKDIKADLWKKLRFRDKNYFHNSMYKRKLWDGFKNFFDKDTGKFLTGLLPEVQAYLEHHNITPEITDCRNNVKWLYSKVDQDFLNKWVHVFNGNAPEEEQKKNFTLRDYQPELTNSVIENGRGIITAPTSAGKSAVMITLVKALPPTTPVLILSHRSNLSHTCYTEMGWWGVQNLGRLYNKFRDPNIVTVANWQSVHLIKNLLPKFRVLIVDEIHDMMSAGPKKIYAKMDSACVRVAVSATPFKDDGKDKVQKYSVKGFFGPILKIKSAGEGGVLTTKKLQDRNILSKDRCTFFPIRYPQLPYAIYGDAVTQGIAENWEFHKIVQRLCATLKGRTLILVERLAHGDYLQNLMPHALWVRGKDNLQTREEVIQKLKRSPDDTIAIATQGIFNAGINVFVHNLINAAGAKAAHQIIQRIGRGLRTADDKEILNYYDWIFEINDYLLDHSNRRVKILKDEGHEVIIKEIDF